MVTTKINFDILVVILSMGIGASPPGSLRNTTAMDCGNADIAGANICRPSMGIIAPPSWLLAKYRPSMGIIASPLGSLRNTAHPWA